MGGERGREEGERVVREEVDSIDHYHLEEEEDDEEEKEEEEKKKRTWRTTTRRRWWWTTSRRMWRRRRRRRRKRRRRRADHFSDLLVGVDPFAKGAREVLRIRRDRLIEREDLLQPRKEVEEDL